MKRPITTTRAIAPIRRPKLTRLCITILLAVVVLLSTASPAQAYIPNDAKDSGGNLTYQFADTGLATAWDYSLGDGQTIAVIDRTALTDTPGTNLYGDPGASYDVNYDTVNDYDFAGDDDNPFSTLTSELGDYHADKTTSAAASGDNDGGSVGGCPNCQVMFIRVAAGGGIDRNVDTTAAIYHAVDHGADVITMSMSSPNLDSYYPGFQEAVRFAWLSGVPVFQSTDNQNDYLIEDNPDGGYVEGCSTPGDYRGDDEATQVDDTICGDRGIAAMDPYVTRVAASTDSAAVGERALFSNWHDVWADVAAPGQSFRYTTTTGSTGFGSGTSFSTPFAAGIAAIFRAENPNLTGQQVGHSMLRNALPHPTSGCINSVDDNGGYTGFGNDYCRYTEWGAVRAQNMMQAAGARYNHFCDGYTDHEYVNFHPDTTDGDAECFGPYLLADWAPRGSSFGTATMRRDEVANTLVNMLQVMGEDLDLPPAGPYSDIGSNPYATDIRILEELGINENWADDSSCAGTNFCPEKHVRRDRLARLLNNVWEEVHGSRLTGSSGCSGDTSTYLTDMRAMWVHDIMFNSTSGTCSPGNSVSRLFFADHVTSMLDENAGWPAPH